MNTPALLPAPSSLERICRECGKLFQLPDLPAVIAERVKVCPECGERFIREDIARLAAQTIRHKTQKWEEICPPQYLNTDIEKLPRPKLMDRVMAWRYGARGLLIHGPTGLGKSRSIFLLLEREHESGRRILVEDQSIGLKYAEKFARSPEEATAWINKMCRAEILFFDDIFKARLTDSLEAALFGVIATRGDRCRPTFFTTNDTGETLRQRLSADRGAALVRRITEHNDDIPFI